MVERPRMCPSGCGSYAAEADLCVVCGGPLVTSLIGVTFETWVPERLLGFGGSGATVWEARSYVDGSLVALKVAPADTAEAQRLRHTAALFAGLHHPNLTNHLAHGDSQDGPWLVMELVRGPTLISLLQQRGALTLTQSLHIAHELLQALTFLHGHGLVHRDLKPGNIHLTANHGAPWTVRLFDFGLADKAAREPRELLDLSAQPGAFGLIVGTPEYMAPEQVLGHEVDGRADLYALGVLLYRLVTGHLPYGSDTAASSTSTPLATTRRHELYLAHLREPPRAPRSPEGEPLPQGLVSALAMAFVKQPRQRVATAEAFLAALST
ncbi:MAG TPA: serine/threonine-protein kinase [Myxococcota bacterium]|nr:serine/threonine-protein kinase [Myxococcota bacterium]